MLDSAGQHDAAPFAQRAPEFVQPRTPGGHFGEQRLFDAVVAHRELTRRRVGQQQLRFASALLEEGVLDRRDHRRLVEHDDRAGIQIVEQGAACVERQADPGIRNVPARVEMRGQRRARTRFAGEFPRNALADLRVAWNFGPRNDVELGQRFHAALRLQRERANALDRIAEELDASGPVRACGKEIEDAAAHRIFPRRADDVDPPVSETVKPRERVLPAGFRAGP